MKKRALSLYTVHPKDGYLFLSDIICSSIPPVIQNTTTNTVTITDENGGITTEQKDLKGQITQTLQHYTYKNEQVDYIRRMMYDFVGNTVQMTNPKCGCTDSLFNGKIDYAFKEKIKEAFFMATCLKSVEGKRESNYRLNL